MTCTIVIATRNRQAILAATLARLEALPDAVSVIVVDNGSSDGTAACVAALPRVRLVRLNENAGAAARTVGARLANTAYVAFSDDDCWWRPGALTRACALLERYPGVCLVNARVQVRDDTRVDDACKLMAASPLAPYCGAPGRAIGAFMAGACVMRREAYLAAGGYERRYLIGAEETLLAADMLEAGYEMIYADDVVLYHDPARLGRDAAARRRLVLRNRLWTMWLRLPIGAALGATRRTFRLARHDAAARGALRDALRGIFWVLRSRRPVSARTFAILRTVVEPAA